MLPFKPELMMRGATAVASQLLPQTVFATSLYTGTGAAQTITNGLDLLGSGGLVWNKSRSAANDHNLMDTARGASKIIYTDLTNAEGTYSGAGVTAFNANGFTLGTNANGENQNSITEVAWSFRQAPKFFQVITYTGDGTGGNATTPRQIAHALGVSPGMVIIKRRDVASNWPVFHRGNGSTTPLLALNLTSASLGTGTFEAGYVDSVTASVFKLANANGSDLSAVNAAGGQYVAYLWAHDPDPSGIISCGSFTTDASGNASVNLGWSPQFLLVKASSTTGPWEMLDTSRGWSSGSSKELYAHSSVAETSSTSTSAPTATGFTTTSALTGIQLNATHVYLAIRAPIFTGPTRPQDAFATSLYTGTGANQTVTNGLDLVGKGGLVWQKPRNSAFSHDLSDTIRGITKSLASDTTAAEVTNGGYTTSVSATGFLASAIISGITMAAWSFVNKPRVFQCLTYTGDGTSGRQIAHALGVAPGMIVVKRRDAATDWYVYHRSLAANTNLFLDLTNAATSIGTTDGIQSASLSTFQVGSSNSVNATGAQYVAYLWGHDPSPDGIVQAGSFTTDASGNATVALPWPTQFLMTKAYNQSGDWAIRDTARGFDGSAANVLIPNLSNAEVSSSGYKLNGTTLTYASGNASVVSVVYLAIRAPTT